MKEKYISFWRHSLEHSKKFEYYKVFKDEYSTSDYLYQLRNFSERRNLVKFNIGNHKLMIELGRYQIDHVPWENRLCPLCKSKHEDEDYFLFQFQEYSSLSKAFSHWISEIVSDIKRTPTTEWVWAISYRFLHSLGKQTGQRNRKQNRATGIENRVSRVQKYRCPSTDCALVLMHYQLNWWTGWNCMKINWRWKWMLLKEKFTKKVYSLGSKQGLFKEHVEERLMETWGCFNSQLTSEFSTPLKSGL